MGDSEKLTALKKSYADIILKTAKEAAARVLVAEKKACRHQRELADAKEDAFRMMLRLKQMMDSRIHEADIMASRQQSKIDELEAQLNEAEDIVKDLREELALVRDELDYMRKTRSQQMSEQQANHVVLQGQVAQGEIFEPSISGFDNNQVLKEQAIHVAESDMVNLFDQRINGSVMDSQFESLEVGNLDMDSNVTLVKELGSLMNESSRRLHELANENLSNEDGLHGNSQILKDDSTLRDDCENSGKSVTQTSSAKVYVSDRKSYYQRKHDKKSNKAFYLAMSTKAYNLRFKQIMKSSSLRKRRSFAKKVLKSLQITSKSDPCPFVYSAVEETNGQNDSGLPIKTVELCSDAVFFKPFLPFSESTPENDKSKIVKVSTEYENRSAESSVTCADSEVAVVQSCSVIEEPDELDADDAFQPKTDRSIKFTFQRKRKKECMGSTDENDTVEVKKSSDGETLVKPTNVESNGNYRLNGPSHPSENKENTPKEFKRLLKRMNIDKRDLKTSVKRVDVEMPTETEPRVIGIVPKATRYSRRLARQLLSMSEK